MNTKIDRMLVSMDEKNWFRMLVCFTPGIVLGKLSSQFSWSPLNVAAPVALLAGVSVYYVWPRLRGMLRPEDAQGDNEQSDPAPAASAPTAPIPAAIVAAPPMVATPILSGANHSAMMSDLIRLCDGSSERAIELINTEIAVDPDVAYSGALERALRRATLTTRKV